MLKRSSKSRLLHSDEELIAMYRNSHDSKYIGELFNRYTHLVFGVCMKYLKEEESAQDATMQVFESLMTHLKKHQIENFRAWLHMVAKNHCLMQIRKATNQHTFSHDFSESEDIDVDFDDGNHLIDKQEKEKRLQKMEKAMDSLKEEQRVCLKLFYLENKSYVEVADITGYSLNQVKSHIQNGKRNLKLNMENDTGYEQG